MNDFNVLLLNINIKILECESILKEVIEEEDVAYYCGKMRAYEEIKNIIEWRLKKMINELLLVVVMTIVVQTVVDTLKKAYKFKSGYAYLRNKVNMKVVIALIVSVTVCILSGIDIFVLLGLPLGVPILGELLTGIIISGGSSVVHNMIKQITEARNGNSQQ